MLPIVLILKHSRSSSSNLFGSSALLNQRVLMTRETDVHLARLAKSGPYGHDCCVRDEVVQGAAGDVRDVVDGSLKSQLRIDRT